MARKFGPLAEDAMQEAWVKFCEAAQDSDFASKPIGYHVATLKNAMLNYVSRVTRFSKYVEGESRLLVEAGDDTPFEELIALQTGADDTRSVEEVVIRKELRQSIDSVVANLPQQQRQIAVLLGMGFKPSEVADKLRISRASVSHTAKRMQANMQKAIDL